jgi:hypothetical protein
MSEEIGASMGYSYGSANEPEEGTSDQYVASGWGVIVGTLNCTEHCPYAEADRNPNDCMTGVAMIQPWVLIALLPRIPAAGRKRRLRSVSRKLSQGCAIVGRAKYVGTLRVTTARGHNWIIYRDSV